MALGKILLILGLGIALIGALIVYAPWTISWFGNLPGDIRIERENASLFIPITSMLLVSVAGSLLINLLGRLLSQ